MSKENTKSKFNFSRFWEKYGTLMIFVILIFIISLLSPYFLTKNNITQVLVQSSIFMIIGMGQMFAILTSGIDLSVGSTMALTGIVTAKLMVAGWGIFPAVIVGGLLFGAFLGFINGTLVSFTKLPPFIITLGTLNIYRGISLVLSEGRPIFNYPYEFNMKFAGYLGEIPIPIIIVIIAAVIIHIFAKYSKAGRSIYAFGGNNKAAWISGVRINKANILAFTISGLMAGLAGILMTARVGAAEPLAGNGYELFAIASTAIGGTSFFGGVGSIPGTLIGALVVGVINNALNILNVQTYYQQIVTGVVIVGTVYANKVILSKKD
jgi:D-allose transport system permease protein